MALSTTPEWFHLSDVEDVVWESRPHPVAMGTGLPIGLALVLAGTLVVAWSMPEAGVTFAVGVAVTLLGIVLALSRYLVWTNTRYVITTDELYKKRGIVSRDVTQFRLDRVQNTTLEQTGVGRVLGYGTLTVFTAGSGGPELTFEHVPQPERASSLLSDRLDAVSQASDRGSP